MNLYRRFSGFLIGNSRSVLLTLAILSAFTMFAFNAMYNQPGGHPQPLWFSSNKMVTNNTRNADQTSVPVRKVETQKFKQAEIPVPLLRPARNGEQVRNLIKVHNKLSPNTKKVQRLLRQLGFYNGDLDGLMGPKTVSAVKKFEKSKGLPENANFSPSLLLLLQNAVDRSTAKSANGIGKLLERENTATLVSEIDRDQVSQVMIKRIQVGLINYGSDDVTIDGLLGDQTKIAIEQFQARFRLKVNGTPSRELIRKLESVGALTRG